MYIYIFNCISYAYIILSTKYTDMNVYICTSIITQLQTPPPKKMALREAFQADSRVAKEHQKRNPERTHFLALRSALHRSPAH